MFSNKSLRNLILPLIIEQMLAVAIGIADTAMVSSVGESAVSGVSLVDSINFLLIMIFSSIATGGAVVASQYIGKGEKWNANIVAKQLEISVLFLSIIISAAAILFRDVALQVIFQDIAPDVMENARIYFFISALSYPFLAVYNAGAALFRSMGDSKTSMIISVGMNLINVAGNAITIYGFKLGVTGAASATLFSRIVGAVVITILLTNPTRVIHIDQIWKWEFKPKVIKNIMKLGIPNGIENSIFQIGKILTMSIVSGFGTASITANAVAGNLASLQIIPASAIGMAMLTVVGQCIGARDFEGAKQYTKKLIKLSYIATWIITVIMLLSHRALINLYTLSGETADIMMELFIIHAISAVVIWPLSFGLPNALRAASDVKYTMIASLVSMWVFRIGLSYVLVFGIGFGVFGIWIAMIVDWVFRSILFMGRFIRGKWKNKVYV